MRPDTLKDVFAPDSGALLDILIFDTSPRDWQAFLDYVSSHYEISYVEDERPQPLPKFEVINNKRKLAAVSLKIRLSGLTVNCHVFEIGRMDLDVLPEDVNTPEKAQSVFDFMIAVASVLKKEVFLVPEFASATQADLEKMALCSADPQSGSIRRRSGR